MKRKHESPAPFKVFQASEREARELKALKIGAKVQLRDGATPFFDTKLKMHGKDATYTIVGISQEFSPQVGSLIRVNSDRDQEIYSVPTSALKLLEH